MSEVSSSQVVARPAWRPQRFGPRNVRSIVDPIVEPMWEGIRVLAHVDPDRAVAFVDEDGALLTVEDVDELARLSVALGEALAAESATLDGYLTVQPTRPGEGVTIEPPGPMSSTEMIGHFLVGGMASGRAREQLDGAPGPRRATVEADWPLAFVAVDLLMLDGESVLDVPLLERKRLLGGLLRERTLVRLTPYVRLPIDTWVMSWRAAGFHAIAYKSANSRYEPGRENREWATVPMPAR